MAERRQVDIAAMKRTLKRAADPRPSGQPTDVASIRAWLRALIAAQRQADQLAGAEHQAGDKADGGLGRPARDPSCW